jgi:hypothetical protein
VRTPRIEAPFMKSITPSSCPIAALVSLALVASPRPARAAAPDAAPPRVVVHDDQGASRDVERIRLGALGGVGFPHPLSIEGLVKIYRIVAVGAEYAAMPTTTVSGVQATLSSVAADVRVFPLRGAFFVGLKAGEQRLGATGSATVPMLGTLHESLSYEEWYVNPRVGFLWTWSPGLTVGMNAGVQLPLSSSMSTTLPPIAFEYAANVPELNAIHNAVRWLGRGTLPTIELLQLGWLF